MIVRRKHDVLELVTQPDHARMAGRIMERCEMLLAGHPRRAAILRAVADHDIGWTETDAAPDVDAAGNVLDFMTAPLAIRHGVWSRAIEQLSGTPWAAALVAEHAITVYGRFRGEPDWEPFFERLSAERDRLIAASGFTSTELARDYPFVRLGDLISLVFCTGSRERQRIGDWTVWLDDEGRVATPDVFGGDPVPCEVEALRIPNRSYGSRAELRSALAAGERITLRGIVTGSRRST